jgi:hypothetical protein
MERSENTLYRRIDDDTVIRKSVNGVGFFYLHTDQVMHRRWQAKFEALNNRKGGRGGA